MYAIYELSTDGYYTQSPDTSLYDDIASAKLTADTLSSDWVIIDDNTGEIVFDPRTTI